MSTYCWRPLSGRVAVFALLDTASVIVPELACNFPG